MSATRLRLKADKVVADALLIFSIPVEKLGQVVVSLSDDTNAGLLIGAIDRVIARR
jgi:hypothetical protein